ncbi:hypothetical protein WT25_16845 [Burkholderia territorii]|nr:hypothetical protein WT25_16845 [Burkholderia territorii]
MTARDYRHAAIALQIALVDAAREQLGARVTSASASGWPITWRELLRIERRAFARSSVQACDPTVLEIFPRLAESRWLNPGLDAAADLSRDDDLPVVIVRTMRDALRAQPDAASSDGSGSVA